MSFTTKKLLGIFGVNSQHLSSKRNHFETSFNDWSTRSFQNQIFVHQSSMVIRSHCPNCGSLTAARGFFYQVQAGMCSFPFDVNTRESYLGGPAREKTNRIFFRKVSKNNNALWWENIIVHWEKCWVPNLCSHYSNRFYPAVKNPPTTAQLLFSKKYPSPSILLWKGISGEKWWEMVGGRNPHQFYKFKSKHKPFLSPRYVLVVKASFIFNAPDHSHALRPLFVQ